MKTAIVFATALLTATLAACTEARFQPRSRVTGPRIVAVIAEPPEARPGDYVTVRVVHGGTGPSPKFRWFICARPEGGTNFTASSTFGATEDDEGCFGDAATFVLPLPGNGPSTFLAVPRDLLQQLEALRAVYGRGLSPEALRRIAQVSGLPVTIGVEMTDGDKVVRAIKRLVVSTKSELNTNPPPPALLFDQVIDGGSGVRIVPVPGDEELCAPEDRRILRVRRRVLIQLKPEPVDPASLQEYEELDATGRIVATREIPYYSFYATAGRFRRDRTRPPMADTSWTSPGRASNVTLWVIARDGRGGTSICRFGVEVR